MVEPSLLPKKDCFVSNLPDLSQFLSISNSAEKLDDVTETMDSLFSRFSRSQGCGFESRLWQEVFTTEVRPLSKAPNPRLLPGRCNVGCPLLHFDGFTFTFTFMHLADAFIQSDLHCIQVTVSTFYQLLLSLGIEPMILALLAPCSTS